MSELVPPVPEAKPSNPSFFHRLKERHVLRYLGLYAGAATSAILFVDFLVGRYALSPHLVDALLLTLVMAVPSVAILAWAHGGPVSKRWLRRPGAVLSCNGITALVIVGMAFWNKPLGATTETVSVETADGRTVERTVAKAAFRKRLVTAFFEGDAGLARAVTYALAGDLNQDLFITAYSPEGIRRMLRKSGFDDGTGAPLALLREAAYDALVDYLVTGRIEKVAAGYRLTASLHATEGRSRPETFTLEGADPLSLVDDASLRIRREIGLPDVHIDEADDLMVSDLFTGSLPALEAYADGLYRRGFADDLAGATGQAEEAVALDSTFALAHVSLYGYYRALARGTDARRALDAAQRHRYRLPEADRLWVTYMVALVDQRPDDALAAVKTWAALYPDDVRAFQHLSSNHVRRGEMKEAIEAMRSVIRLDDQNPGRHLELAGLLSREERLDEALEAVARYRKERPEDALGYVWTGSLQQARGAHAEAEAAFRQAVMLDPAEPRHTYQLAEQLKRRGSWAEAEALYKQSLDRAVEARDRAAALNYLAHYHEQRGQYSAMIDRLEEMWTAMGSYVAPVQVLTSRLGEGYHYTQAGRTAEFEQILSQALSLPELDDDPNFRATMYRAATYAYALTGRTDEVLHYAAAADSIYEAYGIATAAEWMNALRGMARANEGRWDEAARLMAPHVEDSPTDYLRGARLAEIYLEAGDEAKARAAAEAVLKTYPSFPKAHVVLARLSLGDPAQARGHLETALDAWKDADPDFAPAQQARRLLAGLR